jgi:hypothetical protein
MSARLNAILAKYQANRSGLGDNFDPVGLKTELQAFSTSLRRMYWTTAVMIIIVFCLEVIVGVIYLREPAILAGIAAVVGVTIWGAVDRMSRLAREMAETNLLVVLSGGLSPESLDRVVQKLLDSLSK